MGKGSICKYKRQQINHSGLTQNQSLRMHAPDSNLWPVAHKDREVKTLFTETTFALNAGKSGSGGGEGEGGYVEFRAPFPQNLLSSK